ncbi:MULTISPECIES: DUF1656 domain-containing protein [Serratia]|uniref:DUF1656 domain-containing protein n=1 Tax=Serratia TaxID=613 RepID=UPI0006686703|nr:MULTISPECIES: DUF1656 domain-containing protein [Serratia]HBK4689282.1 DUF1656 domain-containing protein [Serratia marcescens]
MIAIGEINLGGVYISSALVAASLAGLFLLILRRAFLWSGFHRLVWHYRLANLAIFIIIWATVARVLPMLAGIIGSSL